MHTVPAPLYPSKKVRFYSIDYAEPMISETYLTYLHGMDEYQVLIVNHLGMSLLRKVFQVLAPDSREWWADSMTGSLYDKSGKCQSGPLQFLDEPHLTGRKVPAKRFSPIDNPKLWNINVSYDDDDAAVVRSMQHKTDDYEISQREWSRDSEIYYRSGVIHAT